MDIEQAIKTYLDTLPLRCTTKTIKCYQSQLRQFVRWWNDNEVTVLDSHVLTRYLTHVKQRNVADDTVHTCYRQLKTFCRYLTRRGVLTQDPFSGSDPVPVPSRRKLRRKVYRDEDISRLLNAPSAPITQGRTPVGLASDDRQASALILLLIDTGMRAGEVAQLTCGAIRREEVVIIGKGGHEGVVYISPIVRAQLYELAGKRADSSPLFRDWKGNAATVKALRGLLERTAKRAGVTLPPRPLHAFRHYYARTLLARNIPTLTIKQFMRHSQLATTELYTVLDTDVLSRIHEEVNLVGKFVVG
jgi:site-specific recombinase XerD